MSATWPVVETNDGGIRISKGLREFASHISALVEVAYLWLTAYRDRQRMRKWVGQLDDHLLKDIGVSRDEGGRASGLVDALMEMSARRSHF